MSLNAARALCGADLLEQPLAGRLDATSAERLRAYCQRAPADGATLADERFRAVLVAALAVVGLVLAALGVYAVTAYAVATQRAELHGPPQYYTPDWASAKTSVRRLAELQPEIAVTMHGHAMRGEEMRAALNLLASDFDSIAVPEHGRYVRTADRPEANP